MISAIYEAKAQGKGKEISHQLEKSKPFGSIIDRNISESAPGAIYCKVAGA